MTGVQTCALPIYDRFLTDRKITFTPKLARELLKDKTAKVKNIYSPKTGKTYDGNVVFSDTGEKYVNYRIEIPKKKKLNSKHRKGVPFP